MKIKKTVTERVIRANRENGNKNKTGPRNTTTTKYNAVTNCFLARKVIFRDEAEEKEFRALVASLRRYHRPVGPTEETQVSEMALSSWRLQGLYGWEALELSRRKDTSATIQQTVRASGDPLELPPCRATPEGWEPREVIVRTGTRSREEEESFIGEATNKTVQAVVEARMTAPIELNLRYGAAIRRDYYRALTALLALQRERLELDQLLPVDEEVEDDKK
jgi:hypothetical protein